MNTLGADDEFESLTFRGNFSGNAFADLLIGLPSTNPVFTIGPPIDQKSPHFAAYAQDEWRLSKSVTLNYGLPWELQPPSRKRTAISPISIPPMTAWFTPTSLRNCCPRVAQVLYQINVCPDVVATLPCSPVQTASQAGLPQGLRDTYWKDFSPRISLAWRPSGNAQTVLRAGFGVFTLPPLGDVAYQMTGLASTPLLIYVNGLVNGKPLFQLPSVAFGNGGLTPDVVGTYEYYVAQQIHYRDPQSTQWNVTAERQFGENWNGRISYIGQNSFRLGVTTDQTSIRASATPYDPNSVPYTQLGRFANWATGHSPITRIWRSKCRIAWHPGFMCRPPSTGRRI